MKFEEERWDEDDACIECGETLMRESKVQGLCQDCFADINKMSLKSRNKMGTPGIKVLPPR
jgi:NMD protein affecting ribosome stability and mRNA decay